MSRGQALLVHAANVAVCATGLVYAWMRYLVEPADEWAVVNHPWQPHVQHLHVLVAPLLVFSMGLIWSAHIIGRLQNERRNRASGIGLMVILLPMAASGYLLQVAIEPGWRAAWTWIHVISSLLWVLAFIAHQAVALTQKNGSESHVSGDSPKVTPFRVTAERPEAEEDRERRTCQ